MNVQEQALRREVLAELEWEPRLGSSTVGVAVASAVVTLTGVVKTYAEKMAAERAAKRVKGVHVVINEIDVKLASPHARADPEIAAAVVRALEWDVLVPHTRIEARVADGWVRLEGTVDWEYQRAAAAEAVHRLTGITGVTNLIAVKPQLVAEDVEKRIEAALKRSADVEARHIHVEAHEGKVVLRGRVHSWVARDTADAAAWAAPGVATVEDELEVAS
jgi:osmotically-inducible protein OsmY